MLPTTEKKTITENKQDLERKHNGFFFFQKKFLFSFKIWKANTAAVAPSLKAKSLPVPKWHHYTVLIVYALSFFSFCFVSILLLQKVSSLFLIPYDALGKCTCNFISGDVVHRVLRILTTLHVIPSGMLTAFIEEKNVPLEGNEFQFKHKASIYSGLLKTG